MGPNRQSLPDKGPSRSPRPRNLCVRIQGKARTIQKEREFPVNPAKFPIFAVSFTSYRQHGIMTTPSGFIRAGFFIIFVSPYAPPIPACIASSNRKGTIPHSNPFRPVIGPFLRRLTLSTKRILRAGRPGTNDACNIYIVHVSSYRKIGVVFSPPQDSANATHIRSFSASMGITTCATFPDASNK